MSFALKKAVYGNAVSVLVNQVNFVCQKSSNCGNFEYWRLVVFSQ